MAPSHLHPRSRMTSSLFATTVLASFFVVALPHVLPCPAPPRVVYADSSSSDPASEEIITTTVTNPDGTTTVKRMRRVSRRRKASEEEAQDGIVSFAARDEDFAVPTSTREGGGEQDDGRIPTTGVRSGQARGRECPVPKPGGVIGELMGFNNKKKQQQNIVDSSSDNHTDDSKNNRSSGSGGGDGT